METHVVAILDQILVEGVLDTADIARGANRSLRTVARWRAHEFPVHRESEERLLETKAVVDLLRTHLRRDASRLWIRSPNPDLGYAKSIDVIADGEYLRVIGAILSMAEGVIV